MKFVILPSGFTLAGFKTWEKLLVHPLLPFSPPQNKGVLRGWSQASQISNPLAAESERPSLIVSIHLAFSL